MFGVKKSLIVSIKVFDHSSVLTNGLPCGSIPDSFGAAAGPAPLASFLDHKSDRPLLATSSHIKLIFSYYGSHRD